MTAAETGSRRKTHEPVVSALLGQNKDLLPSNLVRFNTQAGNSYYFATGERRRQLAEHRLAVQGEGGGDSSQCKCATAGVGQSQF